MSDLYGNEQQIVTKLAKEIRYGANQLGFSTKTILDFSVASKQEAYSEIMPHIASYYKYKTQLEKIL